MDESRRLTIVFFFKPHFFQNHLIFFQINIINYIMELQSNAVDSNLKEFSIFKLALPIFMQMILSVCLGYVDTIMISRCSESAVGSIGNANQIIMLLTLTFAIVSSATGVVVAQYLGARQTEKMNQIYTVSIGFNAALGVFVCIFVVAFCRPLLRLIRVPSEMFPDAVNYLHIVGCFLFCDAVLQIFSQIFNCHGKTSLGMFIMFGMNIFNIGGNYCFLYGPLKFLHLQVEGIAIATSVSKLLGTLACFILFKKIIHARISAAFLRPFPIDLLKKLIKLGVPSAGEQISYQVAQVVITSFVNSLGSVSVNTKIFCSTLTVFSLVYSNAMAGATSIVVGHAVGEGDYDFAYRRVLRSLCSAMVISIVIATLNYGLSPFTLNLFTQNQEIIEIGRRVMLVGVFLEIGRCVNLIVIRSERAAGDVLFPTLLGIGSMWVISVVGAYLFGVAFGFGLVGIWCAMAGDEIFRAVVVLLRWIKGGWQGRAVISPTSAED